MTYLSTQEGVCMLAVTEAPIKQHSEAIFNMREEQMSEIFRVNRSRGASPRKTTKRIAKK